MFGICENPHLSTNSFCLFSQAAVATITLVATGIIVVLHLSNPTLFFGHGGYFIYCAPLSFLLLAEGAVAAVFCKLRSPKETVEEEIPPIEKSASSSVVESVSFVGQSLENSGRTVTNLGYTKGFVVWTKERDDRTVLSIHNHENSAEAVEEIVLKKGVGSLLLHEGKALVTDSSGQNLRIIDLQTRKRSIELNCDNGKISATCLFDLTLVYGTDLGNIHLWDLNGEPKKSFSFQIPNEKIISLKKFGDYLLVIAKNSSDESYKVRYYSINSFFKEKVEPQIIYTSTQEPKLLFDEAYFYLFDKSKRSHQLSIFEHQLDKIALDRVCTLGKISDEHGRAFKRYENEEIDFKIYDGRLYIHYLKKGNIRFLEGKDIAAKYFYGRDGLSCFCIFKGTLLYGTKEGKVFFYHRESGKKISEFQAHKGAIKQILVVGEHIVTQTAHTIKYWDLD